MKPPDSSMSRRLRFGLIATAVLIVAILISRSLIATAPKAERKPPERRARLVEVTALNPRDETVVVKAYGQVEASQRVVLGAEISGSVVGIGERFVPGQQVAKGEVLVRIDPSNYEVAVETARANLAAAKAELRQEQGRQAVARGDFEVLDLKVTSEERSLMLREPQLQAALAAHRTAEAALKRAQLDLRRTVIRAPFDALVLSRSVALGAQVGGASTPLGELVQAEPYWITLLLPVEQLRWIQLPDETGQGGSELEVRDVSQQDGVWQGRVIQLLDAVEEQGRRARVLVEVDPRARDGGQRLLLGSYVEASIQGAHVESVFVIDPAWLDEQRLWLVRDNRLAPVTLEILHRDQDKVLVRGAIEAGEQVVTSRLSAAVEGMQVRLPEEGKTATRTANPPEPADG